MWQCIVHSHTKAIIYCIKQGRDTIMDTAPWKERHQAYTWININMMKAYSIQTKPYSTPNKKTTRLNKAPATTVSPRTSQIVEPRKQKIQIDTLHNPVPRPKPKSTTRQKEAREWHLKMNYAPTRAIQKCQERDVSQPCPNISRKPRQESHAQCAPQQNNDPHHTE